MFVAENLLRNEFFPSELPACFNTVDLANCAQDAINAANMFGREYSVPLKYSGYKSEASRRKFAVPNPYHYCKVVDLIIRNETDIAAILRKSKYSLTAPIEKSIKTNQAYAKKSECIADTKREIEKQYQDNRYEIRLDISAFFDNVYTHSIPWAMHGIAHAKRNRNDKNLLGNQLDKQMRSMNYDQTNGILVGNAASRIISEIILCTIDEQIQKQFPNISCRRFVDDYYIYTKDNAQIQEIISFIRGSLAQYELSFNENKIQINESPFLYGKPWVEQIKQYMHLQPDVFLSKLIMEYNIHKDIAIIKYGLKVISQCRYTNKNWPAMQSRLINLWVRFPSLSDRIMPILWKNKARLAKTALKKAVYSVISESLLLNREQELSWAVWFIKVFDINIAQSVIVDVLKSSSDIPKIVMLDVVYKMGMQGNPKIKQQLNILYNDLAASDVDDKGQSNTLMWTSHWLLAYEVDRNKWLNVDGKTFEFARKNQFFKELLKRKVKFYDTAFVYPEPEERTRNYEFATRTELYAAMNKLKKMIAKRLENKEEQDKLTMTPEEAELYEELVDIWEQEETLYFG